jgi:hypothetical protein
MLFRPTGIFGSFPTSVPALERFRYVQSVVDVEMVNVNAVVERKEK